MKPENKNKKITDERFEEIVNIIAYKQLSEDQADDFIEKVWILKSFCEEYAESH